MFIVERYKADLTVRLDMFIPIDEKDLCDSTQDN